MSLKGYRENPDWLNELPIELPIELSIEGPAGSWAGPAWFKMLLGLGGNRGAGGKG